jgi:hypothetical protein
MKCWVRTRSKGGIWNGVVQGASSGFFVGVVVLVLALALEGGAVARRFSLLVVALAAVGLALLLDITASWS